MLTAADVETLGKNSILALLTEKERAAFSEHTDEVDVAKDTAVVREGDVGDRMFFILEGEASVGRSGLELRPLSAGDHFGDLALVTKRRRAATVVAKTPLRLVRLSHAGYTDLIARHPALGIRFLQSLVSSIGEELVAMTDSIELLIRSRSLPRHTRVDVTTRQADGQETITHLATGTAIGDVLPKEALGARVVAGLLDQRPVSLSTPIVSDAHVAPITMASWDGREIHRRSVSLLVLAAARELGVSDRVRMGLSISTARVIAVTGDVGDLGAQLSEIMNRLVREKSSFHVELWTVEEARSYFEREHWTDAVELLRIWRASTVTLSSVDGVRAITEGPMLPDASTLGGFSIHPHPDGLLLDFGEPLARFFPPDLPASIRALEMRCPRFGGEMVKDNQRWLASMGVRDVGSFNDFCVNDTVRDIIRIAEGFHEKRIGRVADAVAAKKGQTRVIGIAGPSSSGKTTFIKRLTVQLEIDGVHPVNVSLDDYYIDRTKTPRDEAGEYDYEALHALDLELFQDHVRRLIVGETVKSARYDFRSGMSDREGGPELRLGPTDVLVLEGIHGLNPALLGDAVPRDKVFYVFVHPATALPFDHLSNVSPTDVRLLRRIVRDRHSRGYEAADNIARWASVRRGEQLHIYPHQANADMIFDTSLVYEMSVIKVFADRYLLEVPGDHPAFTTAYRLRHLLDRFVTIYPDHVPPTSILREFIGGSGFEY
ncbi:hypothetical protein BH09MYX1_BH09MYX1_04300 [soil metagenome]